MPYERRRTTAKIAPKKLHAHYFDDTLNREVFHKVADKCYWPATKLILALVEGFKSQEKPFRVAYGLSGTLLDQIERYSPDLLDVFKRLADSGMVEVTVETYYHSFSCLFDSERIQFREEARMHVDRLQCLVCVRSTAF